MHGSFSYVVAPADERLGRIAVTAAVQVQAADL
jgi:hypothetical protein